MFLKFVSDYLRCLDSLPRCLYRRPQDLAGAEGYAGGWESAAEASVALPEPSQGERPLCGRTSPLLVAAVDSVQEPVQAKYIYIVYIYIYCVLFLIFYHPIHIKPT